MCVKERRVCALCVASEVRMIYDARGVTLCGVCVHSDVCVCTLCCP